MSTVQSFAVQVDDIGTFVFRRVNMGDSVRIASEFSKLTDGQEDVAPWVGRLVTRLATLKVRTVTSPEGWDIEQMDPEESETFLKIDKVYSALKDRDAFFRKGGGPKREADSTGSQPVT